MNSIHKVINQSLAAKNAIVFFVLLLCTVLLTGYLVFKINSKNVIEGAQARMAHMTEILELKSSSYFANVSGDILYLSSSPVLMEYIDSPENSSLRKQLGQKLIGELRALIISKLDYAQIRVIKADSLGNEIVRLDKNEHSILVAAKENLQAKGHRDYYKRTIQLNKGEIYFSDINLNREYGKISEPGMPTVRAASPIFNSKNELYGIIVINLDLNRHFEELKNLCDKEFELFLINQDFQYLISSAFPEKSFGFDFGENYRLLDDYLFNSRDLDDFGLKIHRVEDSQGEKMFFNFNPISYPRNDYALFIGTAIKQSHILLPVREVRNASLIITFITSIIATIIMLILINRQTKDLKSVTQSILKFTTTYDSGILPANRQDEIGLLIVAFNEMAKKVNQQISDLAEARSTAESAYREKETFLENMSHEIRNPLHLILGFTNLLKESNIGPEQTHIVNTLQISARNLLTLVNDVLDFKKIKAGLITINPEFFNVTTLLHEIYDSFKAEAGKKHINLKLSLDTELNKILCYGDKLRINQILVNLLSNAIKFTKEEGRVTIKGSIVEINGEQINLKFNIIDTGIGIKSEDLARVKRRFERKNEIQTEGSGLGLPIVINLLELMNSSLEVQSEYEQGSDFSFILNTRFVYQKKESKIEQKYRWEIPSALELLIIEDDTQSIFLLDHIFKQTSTQPVIESSINNLASLNKTFDIIISDIQIQEAKISDHQISLKNCMHSRSKLIVMSAYSRDKVDKLFDKIPYDSYLSKPLNADDLLIEICYQAGKSKWNLPNLDKLKTDYDFDSKKIEQVITMMIQEFKSYKSNMLIALQTSNPELFNTIHHKSIVHFKNLNMDSILELSTKIKAGWDQFAKGQFLKYEEQLSELFNYYIAALIHYKNKIH